MFDNRTKRQKQEAAQKCYDILKAKGRNSCAGCFLDFYCPMAASAAKWLFETFLPAIDPTGLTFGHGAKP